MSPPWNGYRLILSLLLLGFCFINRGCGLRCYSGAVGSDSIIDNCGGSCMQVIQRGEIKRGCSAANSANVCDAAPSVTVCYCQTDLCNAATDSRPLTSLTILLPSLTVLLYNLL